ncbi:hypothetical protein ABZS88_43160 [Streptomyces sp. NPDC005480]|uniref:hypothetical protein n=1 Tax=Streptomyces sp. NPDC005480 TaxID=3154880 RepID=UPI0033ABE960
MDGTQWLTACHPDPALVYEQWEKPPHLASVPAGVRFDVLRLFQPLALTVLWELGDLAQQAPVLEEHLQRRPAFYFLAEPGTAQNWQPDRHSVVLTTGDDLVLPSPSADGIAGVQRHAFLWRTPPDGSGRLVDHETLATAYAHARDPERQAARIRAARSVFWGAQHTRRG